MISPHASGVRNYAAVPHNPTHPDRPLACLAVIADEKLGIYFFVFLQRDSDVNRAKPLEGGVDVFGVTFFYAHE